jgi:AcrR family transcriptional regulator
MPKDTFFNLPEEKRELIIDVALTEFSQYPYDKASISRIVDKAGIAKGSMYQYFENKKDLFKYLIDIGIEKKMEILNGLQDKMQEIGMFGVLRMIMLQSYELAKQYPRLFKMTYRLMYQTDEDFQYEIVGDINKKGNDYMEYLITQSIKNGQIKENYEPEILAQVIMRVFASLNDIFFDIVDHDKGADEMMRYCDVVIDLIENGMKR